MDVPHERVFQGVTHKASQTGHRPRGIQVSPTGERPTQDTQVTLGSGGRHLRAVREPTVR